MENQKIKNAVNSATAAEIIRAKNSKENKFDFAIGKISGGDVYLPVHAEGDDLITSGFFALKINEKLANRMILKKCSLETAVNDAAEQYKELYLTNCEKLNVKPVSFDEWLSGKWVD